MGYGRGAVFAGMFHSVAWAAGRGTRPSWVRFVKSSMAERNCAVSAGRAEGPGLPEPVEIVKEHGWVPAEHSFWASAGSLFDGRYRLPEITVAQVRFEIWR
jgi:hypothetical protein